MRVRTSVTINGKSMAVMISERVLTVFGRKSQLTSTTSAHVNGRCTGTNR